MSGKSAGQLAYEAGGGAIHSYERIQRRAWEDLPPAVREGYEAGAAAVETEQVRLARLERDQARGAGDETAAELTRVKHLLDDFTHAVIDLGSRPAVIKVAHAVRAKAGLPIVDQFSCEAGPSA